MTHFLYSDIIVYGFHGCHIDTKNALLDGSLKFKPSQKEYDWLGDGIYFWENDPFRAQEWADKKHGVNAAVIGAKIRLGTCFDMSNAFAKQIVKESYLDFVATATLANVAIPVNKNPKKFVGNPADKTLRYLDRAVLQYTFDILQEADPKTVYDTIRAPFQEGFELYPGSGFREYDHIHLCVRNPRNIKSLFNPKIA